MLNLLEVKYLEDKAKDIRISIIEMLLVAGSGHTAGPLGMADVFTVLYGKVLKHDPKNPSWSDRDRLILSNGHIAPVLYAAMAHFGYFPVSELKTLRKFGTRLQGHPQREHLPGIETTSGPLGSGLSQAVGMCLGLRLDKKENKVFCLLGDGELNEGQNWEALMLAGKEKLGNLICLVDRNHIQIDGFTENIMPLDPLDKKFEAFNFNVQTIDGNDIQEIYDAIENIKKIDQDNYLNKVASKPSVIICRTIPGKGVAEFENDFHYHGYLQKKEDGEVALKRLRSLGNHLDGHHN
jgi:transketolase